MRARGLLALLLAVAAAWPAAANPTLDAASTAGDTGTSTPTVISHTTGASGTWMATWVGIRGSGGTVSTITFGATALAQRATILVTGGQCRLYLWDATVPASTTADVTVTYAGTNSNAVVAVTSFNGVVGVGTAVTTEITAGTEISSVVTSQSTDLVVDATCMPASQTPTIGAGQTANFTTFQDGASQVSMAGSRETGAAGTTTMSWSGLSLSNGNVAQIAYPLQETLPPTLPPGLRLLLGVGP